ncbi:hypothetical protein [Methylobacterium platani]|uniref:Uncharacterized protein n=2 Tax=Methylobacterium platani TaxID=427683 RepID=A0A179SL29_9HYPH|nr:hypothetical protein [Methylobacterium platani]KMO16530.1 hypothetical protein SQ03_14625 [Methylobacterium platani JCM 14648]OAS27751.1 hypothetical protein A5481_00010 [Methylobacterium platani]
MFQVDTKASAMGRAAPSAVPFEARLRQAAVMLTLAVGVPLVLAWFGLLGWGVFWLARSALAL